MSDQYEYRGLMARAWDVLRGDTSGWPDRAYYQEMIDEYGQPALDVGCGTGRLLLDYLQHGIVIEGVDNSPEMLAICRHKAALLGLSPTLYEQPIEQLLLPARYRTIIVPSSTLQLIVDRRQAVLAVRALTAHLLPGGAIVASFMQLWSDGPPYQASWERSAVDSESGLTYRRVAQARFDPDSGLEHTEDRYQLLDGDTVVEEEQHSRSPATLSYTQQDAISLYEQAGLVNVRLQHAFERRPAAADATIFVAVGERGR